MNEFEAHARARAAEVSDHATAHLVDVAGELDLADGAAFRTAADGERGAPAAEIAASGDLADAAVGRRFRGWVSR
ncbi:hypothetical protein [Mycobacterium tilburgii]|uniref:hypothetical protein n=1 Tax=Mycobacterium tilburgii TaxID=44467 RepID=UPI001642D58D